MESSLDEIKVELVLFSINQKAYVQYMIYIRKSEGVAAARNCFRQARDDPRCSFEIFIAAAKMEVLNSPDISLKIIDLGLKKYQNSKEYIEAYLKLFISNISNFEKIFCSALSALYCKKKFFISKNLALLMQGRKQVSQK